jgi:hypothetical protein
VSGSPLAGSTSEAIAATPKAIEPTKKVTSIAGCGLEAHCEATAATAKHSDQRLRDADRLVVSEPLADLPGVWHEIPESTALIVTADGAHELRPFRPSCR